MTRPGTSKVLRLLAKISGREGILRLSTRPCGRTIQAIRSAWTSAFASAESLASTPASEPDLRGVLGAEPIGRPVLSLATCPTRTCSRPWRGACRGASRSACRDDHVPGAAQGRETRLGGLPWSLVSAVGQDAMELAAGADGELGEDLVQVVFDGARAHEQLGRDLGIGQAVASEPADLGFPRGE